MPTTPPEADDDADPANEASTTRADGSTDGGAESYSEADERRDAEDTRAAVWWLGEPPEALRELAEDFERAKDLTRIFGWRDTVTLRKKLARKANLILRLAVGAAGDID